MRHPKQASLGGDNGPFFDSDTIAPITDIEGVPSDAGDYIKENIDHFNPPERIDETPLHSVDRSCYLQPLSQRHATSDQWDKKEFIISFIGRDLLWQYVDAQRQHMAGGGYVADRLQQDRILIKGDYEEHSIPAEEIADRYITALLTARAEALLRKNHKKIICYGIRNTLKNYFYRQFGETVSYELITQTVPLAAAHGRHPLFSKDVLDPGAFCLAAYLVDKSRELREDATEVDPSKSWHESFILGAAIDACQYFVDGTLPDYSITAVSELQEAETKPIDGWYEGQPDPTYVHNLQQGFISEFYNGVLTQ